MRLPTYLSGALFMKSQRLLRATVTSCLDKYDITPTMWVLLGVIEQSRDGIRLIEIAEHLEVKAPLVTTLAQDLITRDLAILSAHPSDKRVKLLMITQNGKQFIKKVEFELGTALEILLKGTTEADLEGFRTVLDTIIFNSNTKK